jgi:hypothetical protein
MEEEATRKQKRMIKKLGLEKLVPLNIHPEKVDDKMFDLNSSNQITQEQYLTYFCKARWQHSYVPTVWSTIKNNLYALFAG